MCTGTPGIGFVTSRYASHTESPRIPYQVWRVRYESASLAMGFEETRCDLHSMTRRSLFLGSQGTWASLRVRSIEGGGENAAEGVLGKVCTKEAHLHLDARLWPPRPSHVGGRLDLMPGQAVELLQCVA